jgi:hypothetical protein|tara:strand:+ start:218 stop:760 length:543 start_codon:yes stop_codon:yes gene_type:complete
MKHIFNLKNTKILVFLSIIHLFLTGCNGKLPGGDARKSPADPAERLKRNLEEGRGFKLSEFGKQQGGVFEFASSNGLWRASLDVIDFMPLSSVNYSGGIIITDWYSENSSPNESIKISIRFMTNEIRSDALNIKVFNKKCINNLLNCKITEQNGILVKELKREILKKATLYNEEDKNKKK